MIQDVLKALNAQGFHPEHIEADGRIHRFDRDGKKNAWYVCFQNTSDKGEVFYVCEWGDWREKENFKYISSFTQTRYDKKKIEDNLKKSKEKFEQERRILWEQTAIDAAIEWKQFRPTADSPYLARKSVSAHGVKFFGGRVIVPVRDRAGKIWGYQTIHEDGNKFFREGTKKEGNFHLIGEIGDVLYFCEGYATGASIHEATKKPVVVCFDAGNINSCMANFRDEAKVICADNDETGLEYAREAARNHLASVVFPLRVGADFNDLSHDEIREIILGEKPEVNKIFCLGYADDFYFYTSTSNRQVTQLATSSHTKMNLLGLMPLAYWDSLYAGKNGPDWDRAADALMTECRRIGIFNPDRIRGAGVWRDEGRTVINMGAGELWVDGKIVSTIESKYIYQDCQKASSVSDDHLTADEGVELFRKIELLNWKRPEFAKFFVGWIMIAPLAGALPWRPHCWLTAGSGSGKSWILNEILKRILGENSYFFQGATTEAGVRQRMKCDAGALLFDEFETDDRKSSDRVESLLELFRQASFETDAKVVKGSVSGRSVNYYLRFSALVSSIRLNLTREQDKNRFTVCEIEKPLPKDSKEFIELSEFFYGVDAFYAQRFFSRGVKLLNVILANQNRIGALLSAKYGARFAQQYGPLLAGYAALTHDKILTAEECKMLVDDTNLYEESEDVKEKDEYDCLDQILSTKVSVVDAESRRRDISITELIHNSFFHGYISVREFATKELESIGIKPRPDKKDICIAFKHPELSKIFRDTKWPKMWCSALSRLPGASKSNIVVAGRQTKCCTIPQESTKIEGRAFSTGAEIK